MNINFKPLINMSFKDKILSIINFIIFVALVLSLIFKNIIYVLIGLIIIILRIRAGRSSSPHFGRCCLP